MPSRSSSWWCCYVEAVIATVTCASEEEVVLMKSVAATAMTPMVGSWCEFLLSPTPVSPSRQFASPHAAGRWRPPRASCQPSPRRPRRPAHRGALRRRGGRLLGPGRRVSRSAALSASSLSVALALGQAQQQLADVDRPLCRRPCRVGARAGASKPERCGAAESTSRGGVTHSGVVGPSPAWSRGAWGAGGRSSSNPSQHGHGRGRPHVGAERAGPIRRSCGAGLLAGESCPL